MEWDECVRRGFIRRLPIDTRRSIGILEMALHREKFWRGIDSEKWTSLKVEGYYEIIKELILSLMQGEGLDCMNHKCLVSYLERKDRMTDHEIQKIDELRKLRNEISYRGFNVDPFYLKMNELEFQNIIKKLKDRIS